MVSSGHEISFPPVHSPDKTTRYVRVNLKMSFSLSARISLVRLSTYLILSALQVIKKIIIKLINKKEKRKKKLNSLD